MLYRVLAIACLALTPRSGPETISSNDNRTPAGKLRGDVLSVRLIAAPGIWFPEGPEGPGHQVYAFGEADRKLSNPGPMLRVAAGTEIRVTIQNRIGASLLQVHGLHDRPGSDSVIVVPPGETRARVTDNANRVRLQGLVRVTGERH